MEVITMDIEIRHETKDDHRETETLTRDAFWDLYKPGCDEHLLLHKIRDLQVFVSELNYVAVTGGTIIGNIVFSKASVVNDNGNEFEVLTMGPVSVLPQYQGKGIGSRLINHALDHAGKMGFAAVLIFGNSEYYSRFGFVNAEKYNIQTSEGDNFDAFMALELFENSLQGIEGKFYIDPVFFTDEKELKEFEKQFPFREKHVNDTQLQ